MKSTFFFLLILLSMTCGVACASSLSADEVQMQHFIVGEQGSQLALLKKIVNINSGTSNHAGVYRVGKLLAPQFQALGFKTYWVEEPKKLNKAGTFIAERKGTKGKRILLIGHLDTVFSQKSSFQSFKQMGSMAQGPGIIDDKGGDVVILYALKALNHIHALNDATITVVLIGDEEDSGKPTSISRKPLRDVAQRSDVALDFECAFDLETATIARRGVTNWSLITRGHEAHSSGMFGKPGFGAVYELARILNAIRKEFSSKVYLTFNPGMSVAGTEVQSDQLGEEGSSFGKRNVIAQKAIVTGDFRYINEAQKKWAREKIQKILTQHLPGTSAEIFFQDGIPAMSPTDNNLQLLRQFSQVSEDLGYGPVKPLDPISRGAADISHVAGIVPYNLSGLGPIGYGAHGQKETLEIDSLPKTTQRAAVLIYRLLHKSPLP